jgi:hypothetical protein
MKPSLFLWILACGLVFSCSENPEKQGRELVDRSILAHGGEDAWREISILKFNKRTRILREDGTVESEQNQQMEYRLKPNFEGKITWSKDSMEHVSTWDGAKMRYFMGENEVENPGFLTSKKRDFDAEFYAVAQPWKLLDNGIIPVYEGQKTLENGRLVDVLKIAQGTEADVRYYYFDPQSAIMVGNVVQMKNQKLLTYHLGYLDLEGMKVQGQSDRWQVDEKGEKLFLRAEYIYSDYQIIK